MDPEQSIFSKCYSLPRGGRNIRSLRDFESLQIIGMLGRGQESIAFKVLLNDKIYALKISESKGEKDVELEICCMTESFTQYTHSLDTVKYFAYFDNSIKRKIKDLKKKYEDPNKIFDSELDILKDYKGLYLVTVSEIITYIDYDGLPQQELNEDDFVDIMFELFIAIYVLNVNGIIHNDLNTGNIGFAENSSKRSYNINGEEHLIISKYMPILFDYGQSYFPTKKNQYEVYDMLEDHWEIMNLLEGDEKDVVTNARNVKDFGNTLGFIIFDHLKSRKIQGEGESVIFYKALEVEITLATMF